MKLSINRWKEKNMALVILSLFFLIFLVLLTDIVLAEGISPVKNTKYYDLGEPVSIDVSVDNIGDFEMFINYGDNEYRYLGDLTERVIFKPAVAGDYEVHLSDKLTYTIIDTMYFTVIDRNNMESSFMEKQLITTDKSVYQIGERVRISYNVIQDLGYKIIIEYNDQSYVYLGTPTEELRFIPKEVGDYYVDLEFDGVVMSSTRFSVIPNPGIVLKIPSQLPLGLGRAFEKEFEFSVEDNNNKVIESFIRVTDKKGDRVEHLIEDEEYDFEVEFYNQPVETIKFKNLKAKADLKIGIDKVNKEKVKFEGRIPKKVFAIDPSELEFESAVVSAIASGSELYKCKDWNFTEQKCYGTWEKILDIFPGEEYNFDLTPDDPGFAEVGLATVNTDKSTYHINESAKVIMVVLDIYGFLVSNAYVELIITNPLNSSRFYSTRQNTIFEDEKGIYIAYYDETKYEGEYDLFVKANGTNVENNMSSYFLVDNFYEFDILRKIPATIDPWKGPFTSNITLVSFVPVSNFDYTEILPINFTIISASGATQIVANNTRMLIWSNLMNNSRVSYSAQAPLVTPDLYEIGPSKIDYGTSTYVEARPWYLAIDPADDTSFSANQSSVYNESTIQVNGSYIMSGGETNFNVWIENNGTKITTSSCSDGTANFECVSSSVVAETCKGTVADGGLDCDWFLDDCKNRQTFSLIWIIRACSGNESPPNENRLDSGGFPVAAVSFNLYADVTIDLLDLTPPIITVDSVGEDTAAAWTTVDTTPSVNITLNENGDCRMSDSDETYDAMSDNTECTGGGTTDIICLWDGTPLTMSTTDYLYIACNDTSGNTHDAASNTDITIQVLCDSHTDCTDGQYCYYTQVCNSDESEGYTCSNLAYGEGNDSEVCGGGADTSLCVSDVSYIDTNYWYCSADADDCVYNDGGNSYDLNWRLCNATTNDYKSCGSSNTWGDWFDCADQWDGEDQSATASTHTNYNCSYYATDQTCSSGDEDGGSFGCSGSTTDCGSYVYLEGSGCGSVLADCDAGCGASCDVDTSTTPAIVSDICYYDKACSGACAYSENNEAAPEFCIDDNDGGTCLYTTRTDPTSAETCYWTRQCEDGTGASLSSSGALRADFCDYCNIAGNQNGDSSPAPTTPCSSSCVNSGTIYYDSGATYADRSDDCSVGTTTILSDTLQTGDVWDGNSAATCDDTECDADCGTLTGTCVGGASGTCECNDDDYPHIRLEQPEKDLWSASGTVFFYYNVSDYGSSIKNCTLIINNTINKSDDTVAEDTTVSFDQTFINGTYTWQINCTDDSANLNENSSEKRNFGVDTTYPQLSNPYISNITFNVNDFVCLNLTLSDTYSGVETVLANILIPGNPAENITLYDNEITSCDAYNDDGIFSVEFLLEYSGDYNWTTAYANDSAGNLNFITVGLDLNVSSAGNLSIDMIAPLVDIEINESRNIDYTFEINCSAQCEQGTLNCTDVTINVQYYDNSWIDIMTYTTTLINNEDGYFCDNLTINGPSCNHSFTITTGTDSGNNDFLIRCKGTSINSPTTNSTSKNLHINEYPVATLNYPEDGSWLTGIEILDGSSSSDVDGSISNYLFEIDDNFAFSSPELRCIGASSTCEFNSSNQTSCSEDTMGCYLRLNVTDNDGLKNNTIITFGIDNSGPTSTLINPVDNENITQNSYVVSATVIDAGIENISVVTFLYRYDSNAAWSSACNDTDGESPFECTWDIDGLGLVDGNDYEIRAYANDSLGNIGANDTHTGITIDRNPPNIRLELPDNGYWSTKNISFVYNVSDNVSNIRNCTLIVDGNNNGTMFDVPQNQKLQFNSSFSIEGNYDWKINCTDYLNNSNISETRTFNIDNSGPSVTLDRAPIFENISSSTYHVNATVSDAGIGNIDEVIFYYRSNDAESWIFGCNDSSGQIPFNCTWDISSLIDGDSYQIKAWANDSLGNVGNNDTHTNITIDTSGPNIVLISPGDGQEDSDGNIIFYYSVTDLGSGIKNCSFYFDDKLNDSKTDPIIEGSTYNFTLTNLTNGDYYWNISCYDDFGVPYYNVSETRLVTVNIQYVMKVDLFLDNNTYQVGNQLGEAVNITTNVSDINNESLDVSVTTDIIKGTTTEGWWNTDWERRFPVYVNESQGVIRTNVDIRVYIGNINGNITSCTNEIRVVENKTQNTVPFNLVSGDDSNYCDIIFLGNVSANAVNENNYFVYYNNSGASNPGYADLGFIEEHLFFEDFSVDISAWTQDAQNDWVRGTTYSYPGGTGAAEVDGSASAAWITPTNDFDLSEYDSANLSFAWYIETRADSGDLISLEYTNGTGGIWNSIDSIEGDVEEGVWVTENFGVSSYYTTAQFNFRFLGYIAHPQTDADFDYVNLTARRYGNHNLTAGTGEKHKWIAQDSGSTGINGLLNWIYAMTDEVIGNYSVVSVGSKALYPNTNDAVFFELNYDQTLPNVTLLDPPDEYEVNSTVTFTYKTNDTLSSIQNCTLYIDYEYEANDTTIEEGVLQYFSPRIPEPGWHNWSVNCTDKYGNVGASQVWSIWVKPPDITLSSSNITFSTYSAIEGENITIYAMIYNIGGSDAFNITVQFWEGDWENGTKIGENITIGNLTDISGDWSNRSVSVNWTPTIGAHNFYVIVDPPLETNGSIYERNETNNYANITYYVPSWHTYYGNVTGEIVLDAWDNMSQVTWNISTGGNIFATETGADIRWTKLQAIGRDTFNISSNNDFQEIDVAMNMTSSNDSHVALFTISGVGSAPKSTKNYIIYGKNISDVPYINSTNNSNFLTGILWDYNDLVGQESNNYYSTLDSYGGSWPNNPEDVDGSPDNAVAWDETDNANDIYVANFTTLPTKGIINKVFLGIRTNFSDPTIGNDELTLKYSLDDGVSWYNLDGTAYDGSSTANQSATLRNYYYPIITTFSWNDLENIWFGAQGLQSGLEDDEIVGIDTIWLTVETNVSIDGEYTGSQDLIYITEINIQQQGKYDIYDYEIRVPAILREYSEDTYDTVSFYAELK